jgi:hypothetical protein
LAAWGGAGVFPLLGEALGGLGGGVALDQAVGHGTDRGGQVALRRLFVHHHPGDAIDLHVVVAAVGVQLGAQVEDPVRIADVLLPGGIGQGKPRSAGATRYPAVLPRLAARMQLGLGLREGQQRVPKFVA